MKKKGIKFIGLILLVSILYMMVETYGSVMVFVDIGSLLIVVLIPLAMIIFADQGGDYWRAIQISMGDKEFTSKEYQSSLNTVNLSIKCVYASGIMGALAGVIISLRYINTSDSFFPGLSVGCLTLLYALIINISQYAISSIIKKELIYRNHG